MSKTSIEWADHSINPFRARNIETGKVGHFCVKVSPGCKNCYSSKLQAPYLTQLEFVASNRPKVELFLEEKALEEVLRRRKPTRYFWCDMTDMFLDDYPDDWIDRCLAVMALTPQHTHMVLTKRSERLLSLMTRGVDDEWMRDNLDEVAAQNFEACHANMDAPERWPLPNVWLGVSVENQEQADARIPHLLQTPAAVRFLSVEPLLGPVDLTAYLGGLDWVIVGGESGPGARSCDLAWILSIVEQCERSKVSCFVKQGGANVIDSSDGVIYCSAEPPCNQVKLKHPKGGDMAEWPDWMRVREFPA